MAALDDVSLTTIRQMEELGVTLVVKYLVILVARRVSHGEGTVSLIFRVHPGSSTVKARRINSVFQERSD